MNIYVVRAEFGKYAEEFIQGGYVAIGWLPNINLEHISSRDELYPIYKAENPKDTSNVVIGQQVGQIARFLLEIKGGDYVITPAADTDYIYYGIMEEGNSYFYNTTKDACPFSHRRKVKWNKDPVMRNQFSVPFQNCIRATLTVFQVPYLKNFLECIGKKELIPKEQRDIAFNYYASVLTRILELDDKEFEMLITHILTALGFEGSERTGAVGDGGVDATGELNIAGMAKMKLFVQAKRYKLGTKINANTVKALRQSIPFGGQGAFITTCDYQKSAEEVAVEAGFPRIGLINGNQLVDILAEHWEDIPGEFKEKLNLKQGLVIA
jgi:predicted Mrr-cat superfamily restriction endonuclease